MNKGFLGSFDIMSRKNFKKGKRNCKGLLSKREIGKFERLCDGVDWCDEDSVFEFGVELGRWSVKLRSLILSKCVDDE